MKAGKAICFALLILMALLAEPTVKYIASRGVIRLAVISYEGAAAILGKDHALTVTLKERSLVAQEILSSQGVALAEFSVVH